MTGRGGGAGIVMCDGADASSGVLLPAGEDLGVASTEGGGVSRVEKHGLGAGDRGGPAKPSRGASRSEAARAMEAATKGF